MAKKPQGTLKLSNSSIAKIAALREKTGARNDTEVVRRALRLYESLLEPKDDSAETPR